VTLKINKRVSDKAVPHFLFTTFSNLKKAHGGHDNRGGFFSYLAFFLGAWLVTVLHSTDRTSDIKGEKGFFGNPD
jgi:hypothetical protein